MRAESLYEAIHAEPFRPFALMLADGTRFSISHPEWILYPKKEARTAVIYGEDESVRIIDVALVLGIDVYPPVPAGSPAPGPNGGE